VLVPGGRLGLLVFVAAGPLPPPLPEGNEFPSEAETRRLLADADFALEAAGEADLGDSPEEWTRRADAVDAEIERRHGADPAYRLAQEQSGRIGRLLSDGALRPWLGVAVAAGPARSAQSSPMADCLDGCLSRHLRMSRRRAISRAADPSTCLCRGRGACRQRSGSPSRRSASRLASTS
jgi:hypothetical protein